MKQNKLLNTITNFSPKDIYKKFTLQEKDRNSFENQKAKRKGNQSELNIRIGKLKQKRNLVKSVSGTPIAIGFS